jgi:hypothetical protein
VPVSRSITIPAGSTNYAPTNDQKSTLGWMGAVQAPSTLCGGASGPLYNTTGATLDVNVVSSSHTGSLSFQFHYRVPVAKNKPNVNCTVDGTNSCQAKWSSTKTI